MADEDRPEEIGPEESVASCESPCLAMRARRAKAGLGRLLGRMNTGPAWTLLGDGRIGQNRGQTRSVVGWPSVFA